MRVSRASERLADRSLSREYPRRSTAGPACTSSTWLASSLRTSTSACTASARPRHRHEVRGAFQPWTALVGHRARALRVALAVRGPACSRVRSGARQLVHSHTWYANFAGHLAKLLYGIPHVMTSHSLGAAPPVEGRAARGRLRDFELLRSSTAIEAADAVMAVFGRHEARHLEAPTPAVQPSSRARDLQRHRSRPVPARIGGPGRRCAAMGIDPGAAATRYSSGASRARRASCTCSRAARRASSQCGAAWCCARVSRTPADLSVEVGARWSRELERERGGRRLDSEA